MNNLKELLGSSDLNDLLNYIEENGGISEEIDVTNEIETANPIIDESATARENRKIVFKQKVREETSKKLMEAILNTDIHPNEYYIRLKSIYNSSIAVKENIVEMIIFFTKGIRNEKYIKKILILLRDIYEESKENILEAYKHILSNWNFEESIKLVLKTINEFGISSLSEQIFELFNRSLRLRVDAAMVLFKNGETKYYRSILDVFCGTRDLTLEEITEIKELLINFVKLDNENIKHLYKYYINAEKNFHRSIKNIVETNISYNLTEEILKDMEKKLLNIEIDKRVHIRIVDILVRNYRVVKNKKVKAILEGCKSLNYLNRDKIIGVISETLEMKIEIYKNKNSGEGARINALIDIAKGIDKNKKVEFIEKLISTNEEEEIFKVIALSIAIENGEVNKILDLFKYIIQDKGELSKQAMHQFGRIKNLKDPKVEEKLKNLCEKLLASEDDTRIGGMLKILDIYLIGKASDEIVPIFLRKLKTSKQHGVQNKIIEFFDNGQTRFSKENKRKIREAIIECSTDKRLAKRAKQYLRNVNKLIDATPTI